MLVRHINKFVKGPEDGERLWVVVQRVANGSGDSLARPVEDPNYDGKNIHIERDAEAGDIFKIEIFHTSPMHVIGEVITNPEKTVENYQNSKLTIRKENDYTIEYEERLKDVRKNIPKRL